MQRVLTAKRETWSLCEAPSQVCDSGQLQYQASAGILFSTCFFCIPVLLARPDYVQSSSSSKYCMIFFFCVSRELKPEFSLFSVHFSHISYVTCKSSKGKLRGVPYDKLQQFIQMWKFLSLTSKKERSSKHCSTRYELCEGEDMLVAWKQLDLVCPSFAATPPVFLCFLVSVALLHVQ